jgi:PhnB protein
MLMFGQAMLMLESEWPTLPSRAPNPDGTSPVVIYLYVEDVDATVERALQRGGKLVVPIETHFWGDRIGWVQDPAGHMCTIATRVEGTTEDQRSDRWSKLLSEKEQTGPGVAEGE